MNFPRKIFPTLKNHLSKKHITVLTGMRRTGKTTLVKELLQEVSNKIYIDLERLSDRELFKEKNYENILFAFELKGLDIKKKMYVGIDEIQLVPEIISPIKYLYDKYNIKFILTGSSSYYLKNLFEESLAGRKKIFELATLDFGEFLIFKNKKVPKLNASFQNFQFSNYLYEEYKIFYEEYISFGGFPEVVLTNSHEEKQDILEDILNSYINIDIKIFSDFRKQNLLFQLIKVLASRVGSKINHSNLAKVCNTSRQTIMNYLELFEKTYLIKRVSILSKSPDREIVKAQKLYFCDNGFLQIFKNISTGAQFENTIFNQLKKTGKCKYYSRKNGKEIDFIIDEKIAFEVKETASSQDEKTLLKMSKSLNISHNMIVSRYISSSCDSYIWGGQIV